jgi:hypothetical protein
MSGTGSVSACGGRWGYWMNKLLTTLFENRAAFAMGVWVALVIASFLWGCDGILRNGDDCDER